MTDLIISLIYGSLGISMDVTIQTPAARSLSSIAGAALLLISHFGFLEQPASAAPFGVSDCSSCPNYQFVRYRYDSQESNEVRPNPYAGVEKHWPNFFNANWDYPAGVMPGEHYGSAIIDLDHLIYLNRRVVDVNLLFTRFDLVNGMDYLSIHDLTSVTNYTGHYPSSPPLVHSASRTALPFSVAPLRLRFNTLAFDQRFFMGGNYPPWSDVMNYVTDDGFDIAFATVCCGSDGGAFVPELTDTTRHQLVFLGAGDTLDFTYPNDQADTDSIVAIWENDVEPGAKYDIYARCNAPPTHTVYDFHTAGQIEKVKKALLLLSDLCTVPGTWYIAVHQESGAETGAVNLVATRHFRNQRRTVDVGFDAYDPDPTQRATDMLTAEITVQKAARFFYGATEGSQVIRSVHVHDTGSCNDCDGEKCDLCFTYASEGRSHCCLPGYATIKRSHWGNARLIAHEWGHQYVVGDVNSDEYLDTTPAIDLCGHSIMGWQWLTNNFCAPGDHRTDAVPGGYPSQRFPGSIWPHWTSPVSITTTPDSYEYYGHPMGGYVGAIVPRGGGGGSCRAGLGPTPSLGHLLIWLLALALCAVQRRKHPLVGKPSASTWSDMRSPFSEERH